MNQQNNDTKPVVVQLPVSLYEGELYVMETELQLPREYQPATGSFFLHKAFSGRLSVHWWGLKRDRWQDLHVSFGWLRRFFTNRRRMDCR